MNILCRSRVAKLLGILNIVTGMGSKGWVLKAQGQRDSRETPHFQQAGASSSSLFLQGQA